MFPLTIVLALLVTAVVVFGVASLVSFASRAQRRRQRHRSERVRANPEPVFPAPVRTRPAAAETPSPAPSGLKPTGGASATAADPTLIEAIFAELFAMHNSLDQIASEMQVLRSALAPYLPSDSEERRAAA